MKYKKTIAQNLIIYALKTFVLSASPLIIFPYVSRVLGTEGVGQVQYAFSIASYFQLLSGLGFVSYGIREGTKYKNDREALGKFSSELIAINTISAFISLCLYLIVIFNVASLEYYRKYLLIFGLYVFIAGFTLDWFISIKEDFMYVTVRTCIFQAVVLLVAFLGIKDISDTVVYGLVLVLPTIFTSITNGIYIYRQVPLFKTSISEIKRHILPILFLFGIIVSANIYSLLDTTMLGIISDDISVGLYTAASKYTRLVVQLVLSLCTVFLPRLTYYLATDQQEFFSALFKKSIQMIFWITIPCAVGMFVLSPELIRIFSGEGFIAAVPTMKILSINIIFSTIDGFLGWQILVPLKREKFLMMATSVGAVMDIILNFIFIPVYGINGAAFATLLSELSVFLICSFSCCHYVPLVKRYLESWKYIICAIISVVASRQIVMFLGINHLFFVVMATVIGTVFLYMILLIILREKLTLETVNRFLRKNHLVL